MKKILVLLFVVLCFPLQALTIETAWTEASEKELHLYCGEDETCRQFCAGDTCTIAEPVCKNCVGTSVTMTYIFKEMGRVYTTGERLDDYFLYDLFNLQNFVSLTSRSVYNLTMTFNSSALRRQFRSLCDDGTAYPVVFFDKNLAREISQPISVWCETGVFQLIQLTELELLE